MWRGASVSRVMRATPDHRQGASCFDATSDSLDDKLRGAAKRFATPTSSSSAAKRIRSSAQRTPRITPASPKLHGSAALASAGAGAKSPEEHADLQRALARARSTSSSRPPRGLLPRTPSSNAPSKRGTRAHPWPTCKSLVLMSRRSPTRTVGWPSPQKQDHQTQQLRSPTGSVRAAPDR